jgi:plasmid stabilization system protein ParE
MMQVGISQEALQDLNDGYLFYETQGSGLGDYFANCLRADIDGLRVTGGIHRVVYRDYHRLLSKVFPYGIFYTMEKDRAVVVWAIIDLRRDPEWIREKLGTDA